MEPKLVCYRCGCERAVHTHYREGLDCGRCGKEKCWGFVGQPNPYQDYIVLAVSLGVLLIMGLIFYFYVT
jgi:hypothetical protein